MAKTPIDFQTIPKERHSRRAIKKVLRYAQDFLFVSRKLDQKEIAP